MAIDYLTSNSGIMVRIGKICRAVNLHLANASTNLPAELKSIADPFELSDLTAQITSLYSAYAAMQQAEVGNRQQLAAYADNVLTDLATVVSQLGLSSAGIDSVLPALVVNMIAQSQTLNASVITIGSVTAAGTNVGNGAVYLTKTLDGSTPPLAGAPAITQYAGLDSELAAAETMSFTCIADSGRSGTAEGSEQFAWSGGYPSQPFDYQAEGSGPGPTLTVAQGQSLLSDGGFENWGGTGNNTLTNWTLLASTLAGTHVFRESSIVHRGTYALKITGDGAVATLGVSQAPPAGLMRARKMYAVVLWMKCGSAPAAGTFECLFTGTGYSASSTEKISIAHGSMPTSYTGYKFFVCTPSVLPSDWTLNVRVSSTLSAAASVYVDSLSLVEVPYHGGVGAVISAGSSRFVIGDKFTVPLTAVTGVFQEFFRRRYGVQLPSDNAAGETISDTLAT